MNTDQAQDVAAQAVASVAPEIDPDSVDPAARLREDLDLDSLDFLNVIEAVRERTGVEIPESDYPLITSIASLASYLQEREAIRT